MGRQSQEILSLVTGVTILFLLSRILTADAQKQDCADRHPQCEFWAKMGQCYDNSAYMHVYCRTTCDLCNVQDNRCQDHNIMCPGWAHNGECSKNKPYMGKWCARSCAFCQPASDHSVPHVHHDIVSVYWKKYEENAIPLNQIRRQKQ